MISSIEKLGYFVTVIGENTKGMFELPVNEQFKKSLDDGKKSFAARTLKATRTYVHTGHK